MAAAERLGSMSYADYLTLERESMTKHEYADGQVYAMAGGSPEHAWLAMRLGAQLLATLGDRPCEVFNSDLRIRVVETGRSTYPDVTMICGEVRRAPDDEHAATNPTLIAEVLSESTETQDRGEKWRHYQRLPSLRAYVLIAQAEARVEVFRRVADLWQYEAAGEGQHVRLDDDGLVLDVDALYRTNLAGP